MSGLSATRDIGPANTRSPPFSPLAGPELDHVVGGANRVEIVLDDEHRVAAVAQPEQQLEQAVHVARVQSDGRLVEHVERVDEPRAERVGEADALRFAAGERARGAIEREIVEADVAEEADAIPRLLEDVRGDFAIERGQLEIVQPRREHADGIVAHLGDVAAAHLHLQRLRAAAWCRDSGDTPAPSDTAAGRRGCTACSACPRDRAGREDALVAARSRAAAARAASRGASARARPSGSLPSSRTRRARGACSRSAASSTGRWRHRAASARGTGR